LAVNQITIPGLIIVVKHHYIATLVKLKKLATGLLKTASRLRFASSGHCMLHSFWPQRGQSPTVFTPVRMIDVDRPVGRSATLAPFIG